MIGMAVQKGSFVEIYDDKGHYSGSVSVGSNGELQGYTSTCINIRKGSFIETYDENGRYVRSVSA